jgi:UDP-N-acetylmuramoyl-tripeptide--D-alanyl-D-alanine ligase
MEQLYEFFKETSGICTDTRNIEKDSFFVALKGANFNGNKFALNALEQGAKYAIVDESEYANNPRIFLVNNCLVFIQNLANYHRLQFDIPIIGITGSNGKTSTKELIAAVLNKKFNTLSTEGNLNNHIGVPLTLLQMNKEHELAVIEMGANKPGDIAELCEIASPTHGIITNIGKAHLEGFGDLKGVVKTKRALYSAIQEVNGTIFYNDDDDLLKSLLDTTTENISYGRKSAAIQGELVELNPFIKMSWKSSRYTSEILQTNMIGSYNFYNFLAAICIGYHLGVPQKLISQAVSNYQSKNNRSQVMHTERNTLIIDCYNANPTSMLSALESFKEFKHKNKIAILGDMMELGDDSNLEHQKIQSFCDDNGIKTIFIGNIFKAISKTNAFNNVDEFIAKSPHLHEGAILLKGSRSIQLEKLIPFL